VSDVATEVTPVLAVIFPEEDEDVERLLDDFVARKDDAYWARFVRQRFSWQRFIRWWVARRWVIPRDLRRE